MKRKTNLFYLNGEETNFITFSNYGESLTGNFLATDWKLYPSRFICVYSKYLDTDDIVEFESRKEILTKYMARFYENKLAFLRDYYKDNNINVESDLKPLDYFLEALFRFNPATGDQKEIFWLEDETKRTPEESHPEYAHTEPESDDYLYISFVGDVTEMDYNGVYSDIISFIGSANTANGYVKHVQTDPMTVTYTEDTEHLYGWTLDGEWIGPEEYKTVQPLFDMDNLSDEENFAIYDELYDAKTGICVSYGNLAAGYGIDITDLVKNVGRHTIEMECDVNFSTWDWFDDNNDYYADNTWYAPYDNYAHDGILTAIAAEFDKSWDGDNYALNTNNEMPLPNPECTYSGTVEEASKLYYGNHYRDVLVHCSDGDYTNKAYFPM